MVPRWTLGLICVWCTSANAQPQFSEAVSATFDNPGPIVTVDIDGDGHLDLVVVGPTSDLIAIFLGRADGTFAAGPIATGAANATAIAAADFDGDAFGDVAIATDDGLHVQLWHGSASGMLSPGFLFDASFFEQITDLVATDLNGDGFADIAMLQDVSHPGSVESIPIYFGDGTGTFGPTQAIAYSGPGAARLLAADLGGDGLLDIVASSEDTSSGLVGSLSVSLAPSFATSLLGDGDYGALAAGDFDEDGTDDLVVANAGGFDAPECASSIEFWLDPLPGTVSTPSTFELACGPHDIVVADFDGDGHADIAATDPLDGVAAGVVSILSGDGAASFATSSSHAVGVDPRAIAVGDWNGDGRPDLAVVNRGDATVSILVNAVARFIRGDANGDGSADLADAIALLAFEFAPFSETLHCADAADSNDDGVIDIADVVFELNWLFVAGSPPLPSPSGTCGIDPTLDPVDCGAYVCP